MDTEVATRWWWYDGKSTNRLMIFVGQWVPDEAVPNLMPPFGCIILPDILLEGLTDKAMRQYRGLPVASRRHALGLIRSTIISTDVLVGHNLTGFDIGTINGELKLMNLPALPERPVVDTLKSAAPVIGQSMSLANRLSRLDGTIKKPHVDPAVWEAAFNEYDPTALREVWDRACADVQGHIDLYLNDREKGYV
jgi:hypothetical protein